MPSQQDKAFSDHIVELMQGICPVQAHSMFGGHGLFLEGLMLGLIAKRILYLYVDALTKPEFQAMGLLIFIYKKNGMPYVMSYFEALVSVFECETEMSEWSNNAYGSTLRAASKKTTVVFNSNNSFQ